MDTAQRGAAAGAGFLGVGLTFIAVAAAGDQSAFLGVGLAFFGLGIGRVVRRWRGAPR